MRNIKRKQIHQILYFSQYNSHALICHNEIIYKECQNFSLTKLLHTVKHFFLKPRNKYNLHIYSSVHETNYIPFKVECFLTQNSAILWEVFLKHISCYEGIDAANKDPRINSLGVRSHLWHTTTIRRAFTVPEKQKIFFQHPKSVS